MNKNKRYHLVIIGLSGSGKGEQSKLLSRRFGLVHISAGSLLRKEVAKETPIGLKFASFINSGRLVSDKLVVGLVKPHLQKATKKGFVLDGLPRTINQARILSDFFSREGIDLDAVLLLDLSTKVVLERREKVAQEGKKFQKGRQDNSLAILKKRFSFYRKNIGPLVDFYLQKGLLVRIDGQRSIEEIHKDIVAKLEKIKSK